MPLTRTSAEVRAAQQRGLEEWTRYREAELGAREHSSREDKMDAFRRAELLDCQHAAVLARLDARRDAASPTGASARAVLAVRQDWYADRLAAALSAQGVEVVARCGDGAEAVGTVVAEQPELLVTECRLPMQGGTELVADVRRFAPGTLVVAIGAYVEEVDDLRSAGAVLVFSRQRPVADVVEAVVELVTG